MKKLISLALILCLILSLGINASAAESHTESATAIFRDIRILLHGRELIPCNEQGVTVEPFIIDGTTYLPVRAVAQALGLTVGWDDATSTVSLTSGGVVKTGSGQRGGTEGTRKLSLLFRDIRVTLDGKELELVNVKGEAVEPFIIDGTTYLPVRVVGEALGLTVDWDDASSTVLLGELGEGSWLTVSYVGVETINSDTSVSESSEAYYDAEGRLIQQDFSIQGLGYAKLLYSYDGDLLVREIFIDRYSSYEDTITKYEYDAHGCMIRETTICVPAAEEEYTDYENVPFSYYCTMEYNENGDLVDYYIEYDDGSWEHDSCEFDSAGRLTHEYMTDSDGEDDVYCYIYDANGRLVRTEYYENDSFWSVDTAYDERGNEISYIRVDGDQTTTLLTSYDQNDKVLSYSYRTVYHDSEDGQEYFSGEDIYYTYDANGRLLSERTVTLSGYTGEYSYTYTAAGDVLTETYTDSESYHRVSRNSFDAKGRLIAQNVEANDGYWEKFEWAYDANDNTILEKYSSADGSSRVVKSSYDENGNVLTNEIIENEIRTYEAYIYDKFGNLIHEETLEEASGDSYNVAFDFEYEFFSA